MGEINVRMKKRQISEMSTILTILFILYVSVYHWGYIAFYGITVWMFLRIGLKVQKGLWNGYFNLFLLPHILILLHAGLCMIMYRQTFYIFRSVNNFLYAAICIMFSYSLYVLHGGRTTYVLFRATALYYFLRVAEAFAFAGPITFIENILIPGNEALGKWLEAHDIGLAFGLVLLYFLFYERHQQKTKKIYILIAGAVFYLCWKRIAIAAFLVSAAFIIIYNKKLDKRNRFIAIWGAIGVMICLTYVYLVRSQILIKWFYAEGINSQGRDKLYRFIEKYYEFSLTFFGRGSGYTGKLLTSLAREGKGVGKIVALHSDILRVFIEYGALGSILWYAYYLIILPSKFKRKNKQIHELLFVMALYSFMIYLTDNASSYMIFQMFYILLPLQYSFSSDRVVTDG